MGSSMTRTIPARSEQNSWRFIQMICPQMCGFLALFAIGSGLTLPMHASVDGFVKPTPEELAMTSLPGYPGAPAVVLYREEITKDDLHEELHYERIKILTEEGKRFANVQLRFAKFVDSAMDGDQRAVEGIMGRTIHADGTIINFSGEPFLKTIEKVDDMTLFEMGQSARMHAGVTVQERVFTLPDVDVGSIIEYRYATRWNEGYYEPPDWYLQGSLYIKSALYEWYPGERGVQVGGVVANITNFKILPPDSTLKNVPPPGGSVGGRGGSYELRVHDIPPIPKEELMPPLESISYRVLFNYTPYASIPEYWKSEGKDWFKRADSFIGHDAGLSAATQTITNGAGAQEEKLRKIYAAVMALENTDFTRERGKREDKAAGLGAVDHAVDVLTRKRGTSREITELFVGMARAAGMKAYLMLVPDRSYRQFNAGWASFAQFDGLLAIVNIDGKEVHFDPGSRYCPYGQIAWENSFVEGLRATDKDPEIAPTPGDGYADNATIRVANLSIDEHGSVQGSVNLKFSGSPALHWRQESLRGDDESVRHRLRTTLEDMVPKTLEVTVKEIKGLDAYEEPLLVTYEVSGKLGTPAGKRLVVPVDLFSARQSATFPGEKRETPVYFRYPRVVTDALRINLAKGLAIEAAPASSKFDLKGAATYLMTVTPSADSVTVHRDCIFGAVIVPNSSYAALRSFYSQFEAKDQESVVLKVASNADVTAAGNGGN